MTRLVCIIVELISSLAFGFMPTTAADYKPKVFRNANMGGVMDNEDVKYLEEIIEGTNEANQLSDAIEDAVPLTINDANDRDAIGGAGEETASGGGGDRVQLRFNSDGG